MMQDTPPPYFVHELFRVKREKIHTSFTITPFHQVGGIHLVAKLQKTFRQMTCTTGALPYLVRYLKFRSKPVDGHRVGGVKIVLLALVGGMAYRTHRRENAPLIPRPVHRLLLRA